MSAMVSQITSLTIVYSTVYSGTDQRKPQRSASLAFVREIHRWTVNAQHKGPLTQKMFPFDDVIMKPQLSQCQIGTWNSANITLTVTSPMWISCHVSHIAPQPFTTQGSREVDRPATNSFLWYWRVCLLTAITPYDLCTSNSHFALTALRQQQMLDLLYISLSCDNQFATNWENNHKSPNEAKRENNDNICDYISKDTSNIFA